ncbi:MAG: MucBP domain-containing protein [Bacilli bacterium]
MKKVLLSLVAFLMIFNTVFAEEVEVLENDNEVTETVLTTNVEETNTTDTSNDVKEETEEYKWAAIQPGSTKTSDGVTVSWKYVGITKKDGLRTINFDLTYTIPEDYNKDSLIINPDIFEVIAWGQEEANAPLLMPRDTVKVNLTIINNSKYNYNYDENSFVIYPYTSDELKELGFEKIKDGDYLFNGEGLNDVHQYYRTKNKALVALTCDENKKCVLATTENLDKLLREKGYNGKTYNGIDELDKYYLDFYNDYFKYTENNKKVTKLSDFTVNELSKIFDGNYYILDGDGIKEENATLIALHFDFLYNYLLGVSLDDEEINDKNQHEYASGEYMRNESKGDNAVKKNLGKLNSKSENSMNTNMHLNGPLTGNAFMNYRITGHAHLSYTAEKGRVIAKYIDIKGNVLSEDVITSSMVNDDYKTNAKDINGYALIKVEGNETGLYQNEDIIVTYIYEFVDGKGGDDVPNTAVNTNNALEITTIFSVITLTVAVILRKRFKKLR